MTPAGHGAPNLLFDPHDPSTVLIDTHVIRNIHHPAKCTGRGCPIHHPSRYHMAAWPLRWRDDRALMERLCPHGVGHPDWDDLAYFQQTYGHHIALTRAVHGCCPDRCCVVPRTTRTEEASA